MISVYLLLDYFERVKCLVCMSDAWCCLFSNDGAKIRLFYGTAKFRVAIRTDFQQGSRFFIVKKTNSL